MFLWRAASCLRVVGILVFVDVEIRPALLIFVEDLRLFFEEFEGFEQEVVEVEGVGAAEGLLVRPVEEGRFLLRQRGRHTGIRLRHDHLVFGAGDQRPHRPWAELLLIDVVAFHQGAQQAFGVVGVVDREVARKAEAFAVAAQQAGEGGVEGAHPHAPGGIALNELVDALFHLAGSLVGKGVHYLYSSKFSVL